MIECSSQSTSKEEDLAVCHSVSRLESGNVLSYFLYSDQLKDIEEIDTGIRQLIHSFELQPNSAQSSP
jgi:hypothetical protein